MLKNILKLEGAQQLSKSEQKAVKGKGGELMACRCPNGTLVVGHADDCSSLINHFCELDS
jgi:hypothetical protein